MNLIALLIGLVIERLATQLFHWRRMRWMDRIIDYGFRQAQRVATWPAVIPIILLGIVLVLPVFGVIWFLGDTLAGVTYLLLAVIVLFFSLGPRDVGHVKTQVMDGVAQAAHLSGAVVETGDHGHTAVMRSDKAKVYQQRCSRAETAMPNWQRQLSKPRARRGITAAQPC